MFYSKFISCQHMFRAHVLIIRRSKLHYTASGIIISVGGIPVPMLRDGTVTYRCDDNRCCIIQFWSPDDEHMCSKYVEAWNKLIVKQKFCVSSWFITEIKKTTENVACVLPVHFLWSSDTSGNNMNSKTAPFFSHIILCATYSNKGNVVYQMRIIFTPQILLLTDNFFHILCTNGSRA